MSSVTHFINAKRWETSGVEEVKREQNLSFVEGNHKPYLTHTIMQSRKTGRTQCAVSPPHPGQTTGLLGGTGPS